MRIAVLSTGRFHVCDLARELDANGHEVLFYSHVPESRTRRFGLAKRCVRSVFWFVAPGLFLRRVLKGLRLGELPDRFTDAWTDFAVSMILERCDVVIAMSGIFRSSTRRARAKFGAKIWIERGSRHILSQKEILDRIRQMNPRSAVVSDASVEREIGDYALADCVVIPSRHVQESFEERGFDGGRLFRNPYGVDLGMFPVTDVPPEGSPTFLMAGSWSLRKGCDTLVQAWCRLPGTRLMHVGSLGDCPFPNQGDFLHVPGVNQSELWRIYAQAHVLVLASREEGLALVLPQALACGLRIVCTDRSGGADLAELLEIPGMVWVVGHDDPDAFAQAMREALAAALKGSGPRNELGPTRAKLSWAEYGKRYHRALLERA